MSDDEKGPYERCGVCGKYGYDRVGYPNSEGKFCRECVRKFQDSQEEYRKDEKGQRKRAAIEAASADRYAGRPGKNAEKCETCDVLMSPVLLKEHLEKNHEYRKCPQCQGRIVRAGITFDAMGVTGPPFCSGRCLDEYRKLCVMCRGPKPHNGSLCDGCYGKARQANDAVEQARGAVDAIKFGSQRTPMGPYSRNRRMTTL